MRSLSLLFLLLVAPLYSTLPEAERLYSEAMESDSLTSRSEKINDALTLYLQLEESYPSGELYYNIANCFYLLREYPRAVLYYKRAQLYYPRSSELEENLALALRALGRQTSSSPALLSNRELYYLSLFSLGVLTLLASLALFQTSWWGRTKALSAFVIPLLLFTLFKLHELPSRAVMLSDAELHKGAGSQYQQIGVVHAGEEVELMASEGSWVRVSREGSIGYLPVDSVHLVRE